MTLLAVGAGQCAVIEPPSGRVMLIDAGSLTLRDMIYKCLGPYLRHRGHTEIDSIVISHANYDHFSAVAELAAAYDVREVMTGAEFAHHSIDSPPAEAMLRALDDLERPPRTIVPGDRIPLGRRTHVEILWPPARGLPAAANADQANDASVVLRLVHGDRAILFTGDIQEPTLRELLKEPEKFRADVLIAPHHGSSEPSTAAFLDAVDPSTILCSNDRTLSKKQRDFEKLANGRILHRTHKAGAVTVTIDGKGNVRVASFVASSQAP
jgi:competence protein ComEC